MRGDIQYLNCADWAQLGYSGSCRGVIIVYIGLEKCEGRHSVLELRRFDPIRLQWQVLRGYYSLEWVDTV